VIPLTVNFVFRKCCIYSITAGLNIISDYIRNAQYRDLRRTIKIGHFCETWAQVSYLQMTVFKCRRQLLRMGVIEIWSTVLGLFDRF